MLVFFAIKYVVFIFDSELPKYHYIQIFFKWVSIGQAPEQIFFHGGLKCICFQYVLRHYVTEIINGAMCDTYNRMAILVGDIEKIFSLWNCGQLVVILLRNRLMKNNKIDPKNETICGLKLMLNKITRWCDYIE